MVPERSIWKDFLRLTGFLTVEKPKRREQPYVRVGYPWPYLNLISFEKYKQLKQKTGH